ncbi:SWIB/MDM2 domain-containing protein [Mycena rebaudengoi]|nr:SWIB/MDM2 domain-containing protein [Mycena rebaudengoi]
MLFFKIPNLSMIHRCTRVLEMERKLDWAMTRKRAKTLSFGYQQCATTRILRIFMSHTVSSQSWQTTPDLNDAPNFETGEGIPAWAWADSSSRPRKFSTFIKRMIVDLDRDATLYPDGNIVEWPRVPNPPLDGFTIRRKGDVPTKVRVIMVIPELGSILGIKEDSRIGVIQALWNYIKIQGLQDKVDRRLVRADEKLRPIFNGESILFQKLPELVNRCLASPEPIVLHYMIDPTVPSPKRPLAWGVEIKTEDLSLKSRMAVMVQATKDSA